jgi:hypothetical protein
MCSVWTASESVRVDEAVVPVARRFGRNSLHEAAAEDRHAHKCKTIMGSVNRVGGTVVGEQDPSAGALVLFRRPIAVQQEQRSVHDLGVVLRHLMIGQQAPPSPVRAAPHRCTSILGNSAVPHIGRLKQRRGYVRSSSPARSGWPPPRADGPGQLRAAHNTASTSRPSGRVV